MSQGSDEGAAKIVQAVAAHPISAIALFGGLFGGIVAGSIAYMSVTSQLSDHTKKIEDITHKVDDNDRKSSDKLDKLSADLGDMRVQIGRIGSSIEYLVRNQPQRQGAQ